MSKLTNTNSLHHFIGWNAIILEYQFSKRLSAMKFIETLQFSAEYLYLCVTNCVMRADSEGSKCEWLMRLCVAYRRCPQEGWLWRMLSSEYVMCMARFSCARSFLNSSSQWLRFGNFITFVLYQVHVIAAPVTFLFIFIMFLTKPYQCW